MSTHLFHWAHILPYVPSSFHFRVVTDNRLVGFISSSWIMPFLCSFKVGDPQMFDRLYFMRHPNSNNTTFLSSSFQWAFGNFDHFKSFRTYNLRPAKFSSHFGAFFIGYVAAMTAADRAPVGNAGAIVFRPFFAWWLLRLLPRGTPSRGRGSTHNFLLPALVFLLL